MNNGLFVIERARAEDAAALLDYLKIVGGETENLSFGAEGVPLDLETEQDYLRSQCESADNVQYLAKVYGCLLYTSTVFLFAHGYASMIANNELKYDEDTINSHLERAYRGAILAAQEEMA